jgi:hypothetical protein
VKRLDPRIENTQGEIPLRRLTDRNDSIGRLSHRLLGKGCDPAVPGESGEGSLSLLSGQPHSTSEFGMNLTSGWRGAKLRDEGERGSTEVSVSRSVGASGVRRIRPRLLTPEEVAR